MSKSLELLDKFDKLVKNYNEKIGLGEIDLLGLGLSIATIEKELKALDLIRKKYIYWDIQYQPYEKYNDYRAWDSEAYYSVKLTKEEYDLLTEVLSNE